MPCAPKSMGGTVDALEGQRKVSVGLLLLQGLVRELIGSILTNFISKLVREHFYNVHYAVTSPESVILFSADHELIIRWGGSVRCKNCDCRNGALVCLWSIALLQGFRRV